MPRLKQAQVLISNAYVIERARQVESEIVSGLSHFRNMVRGCEARIAYGEDCGEKIVLLLLRDHVDVLPSVGREVYMILRNEEECHGEGQAQRGGAGWG